MSNTLTLDFKKFPKTRYQGSKRKILFWIYESILELNVSSLLDAYGGSASVSYLAKKMGKAVVYNDIMRFNYLIGKSLIENNNITISNDELTAILKDSPRCDNYSIVSNNFEGIYFLPEENLWIDKTINNIDRLFKEDSKINDIKKAICFNALFQSSLAKRPFNLFHRRNLYLRLSDVKRNFGNKTTWEKSFELHFANNVNEINSCVFDNHEKCYAINESALNIDLQDFDCIYIDPPYVNSSGSSESSNYSKCYHFLEGISRYKEWENLIDSKNTIRSFKKDSLDYTILDKANIIAHFEELFEKFKRSKIIVSYKEGGIPSIEKIEQMLKVHNKRTKVKFVDYSYALNRQNKNGLATREALIIAY